MNKNDLKIRFVIKNEKMTINANTNPGKAAFNRFLALIVIFFFIVV